MLLEVTRWFWGRAETGAQLPDSGSMIFSALSCGEGMQAAARGEMLFPFY